MHAVWRSNVRSDRNTCKYYPRSAITSYVFQAADLRTVKARNYLMKYADDTYLIIPACNVSSRQMEIDNIGEWAQNNNLTMNRSKSAETVFTDDKKRRSVELPQPLPDIVWVQSLKVLGITISSTLSLKAWFWPVPVRFGSVWFGTVVILTRPVQWNTQTRFSVRFATKVNRAHEQVQFGSIWRTCGMQWRQWIWTYLWSESYDAILCVRQIVYMNKNGGF